MRIQSGITGGGVDFDTLYRANRSMLVRLIRLAGATEDEADDAVQAAFAALLQVSYPVRDPLAWLHRTALNDFRCSNHRIPSRRRKVTESPILPWEIPEPNTVVPSAAEVAALGRRTLWCCASWPCYLVSNGRSWSRTMTGYLMNRSLICLRWALMRCAKTFPGHAERSGNDMR
jgi:hypothetical protein